MTDLQSGELAAQGLGGGRHARPEETGTARKLYVGFLERDGLVDALFLLGAAVVVGLGWWGTYDGWIPLAGWVLGVAAGAGLESVASPLSRRPLRWLVRVAGVATVYLLTAPLLGHSHEHGIAGPGAWGDAAATAIRGWRELLTTLPPLRPDDPVAALPLLSGLLLGWAGMAAARGRENSLPAVSVVLAGAVAVTLLGTANPVFAVLRGVALACVLVPWVGVRRARWTERNRQPGVAPVLVGAVLLSLAAGVGVPLTHAVGTGTERLTLREKVDPPVTDQGGASLLAGFRRFRPVSKTLADRPLLQVSGLPSGAPVRMSVLDCYTGTVWAACGTSGANRPGAGSFWKVGATIPTALPGDKVDYRVRIDEAYATDPYLRGWVPSAGALASLSYGGEHSDELVNRTRVNTVTGAALAGGGLSTGDEVIAAARPPEQGHTEQLPETGGPYVDAQQLQAVSAYVARWGGADADPWRRLQEAAKHLRESGAYSDGDTDVQRPVLPGHGVGRIEELLSATEPAGNDEQYVAAVALMANSLGLPARVVVGGIPDGRGVLHGRDVRAWVEIVGKEQWVELAADRIVPPRDKRPKPVPKQEQEGASSAIVPPPNTSRRPGSQDPFAYDAGQGGSDRWSSPLDRFWLRLPVWARVATVAVVAPPAVWGALGGALIAAKSFRRRRRKSGTSDASVQGGWSEIVDRLADRRVDRRRGASRTEQAAGLGEQLRALAARADAAQFGPGPVPQEEAAAYWREVRIQRRALIADLPWWRRWLVATSPRSLLPGRSRSAGVASPSAKYLEAVSGARAR